MAGPVSRFACGVLVGTGVAVVGGQYIHPGWPYAYERTSKIVEGCYYQDRKYVPTFGEATEEADHHACQQHCQAVADCAYWTYAQDSKNCWLSTADAVEAWASTSSDVITGPRICQTLPSGCVESPGEGFPGKTQADSGRAWPSHRVPEKGECWPGNSTGGWYDSCPTMTVIESTEYGWPGKCMGLEKVEVPANETCASFCRKTLKCAVYQESWDKADCWQGDFASNCFVREGFVPGFAARIMHGDVRVLRDLKGVEIKGLAHVFDEYYFVNQTIDATQACRFSCYSNIGCQYWIYSKVYGCYMENPELDNWPMGFVQFPPTTQVWINTSDFAKTVDAGEYIQRLCKGAMIPSNFQKAWRPRAADQTYAFASDPWAAQNRPADWNKEHPQVTAFRNVGGNLAEAHGSVGVAPPAGADIGNVGAVGGAMGGAVAGAGAVSASMGSMRSATMPNVGSVGMTVEAPDNDNDSESGLPWWVWLLLGICLLCCLGSLVVGFLMSRKKPKTGKRGLFQQQEARQQWAHVPSSPESPRSPPPPQASNAGAPQVAPRQNTLAPTAYYEPQPTPSSYPQPGPQLVIAANLVNSRPGAPGAPRPAAPSYATQYMPLQAGGPVATPLYQA